MLRRWLRGWYDGRVAGSPKISWEAPEFEYHEKGISWYWLTIIIAVILVAISVWQRNFLFGVFIVIAETLILAWGHREPRAVVFELNEKGIVLGNGTGERQESFLYTDLANFSAEESEGKWSTIAIRFRKRFRPIFHIKVPREKFLEIDEALRAFLTKVDAEKSLADVLGEFIRF